MSTKNTENFITSDFNTIAKNLDNLNNNKSIKLVKFKNKNPNKNIFFKDLIRSQNTNEKGNLNLSFPSSNGATNNTSYLNSNLVTGSGQGGIIYSKSYKSASSLAKNNDAFDNSNLKLDLDFEKSKLKPSEDPSLVDRVSYLYKKSPFNLDKIQAKANKSGYTYNILLNAVLGSLIGSGLGLGKNLIYKILDKPTSSTLMKDMLYGSLGGLGLGGLYGYTKQHDYNLSKYSSIKKYSFSNPLFNNIGRDNDMLNFINNKIFSDNSLSLNQKTNLITYIEDLSYPIIESIYNLLKTATGSGIGYLIASYLLGLGKRGQILLAIAGGLIANNFFDKNENSFNPIDNFNYSTY